MSYSRPPNGMPAGRNLSLTLASRPLVEIRASESGEAGPLDDVEYSLRSDSVGAGDTFYLDSLQIWSQTPLLFHQIVN